MCTLFKPLYTYDQLFVLHCTATWRQPGIIRGLESEFILTNERPAHEPHRPIIIVPNTFFPTNRPTIHPTITTHRSSLPELNNLTRSSQNGPCAQSDHGQILKYVLKLRFNFIWAVVLNFSLFISHLILLSSHSSRLRSIDL
jgi:hypothetical protein